MKHFLSLKQLSQQQLFDLLSLAKKIKANLNEYRNALDGKSVVMLFEKPSLRIRVSLWVIVGGCKKDLPCMGLLAFCTTPDSYVLI